MYATVFESVATFLCSGGLAAAAVAAAPATSTSRRHGQARSVPYLRSWQWHRTAKPERKPLFGAEAAWTMLYRKTERRACGHIMEKRNVDDMWSQESASPRVRDSERGAPWYTCAAAMMKDCQGAIFFFSTEYDLS